MSQKDENIDVYNRLVIKIGSSLLVDPHSGKVRLNWLNSLISDIANLHKQGKEIILVSSGAIAMGRAILQLPKGKLKLSDSQAAASVGQVSLSRIWNELLSGYDIIGSQILLTWSDTEERRHYLNARSTLSKLLEYKVIPVINENDTVATTEIRYGDNDRLAARVATMMSADCLILLSDVDGLYTAPPHLDENATHIPLIETITPELEEMAGEAASGLARGGMITKIAAAKIATQAGVEMIIASGKTDNPLQNIRSGDRHSRFLASQSPALARKIWIGANLHPLGELTIDNGAQKALKKGKSLLPAGVTALSGEFQRGDPVLIINQKGEEIARGLVAYDSSEAEKIIGQNSDAIEDILGYHGRDELVHRDNLVMKRDLQ